MSRPLVAVLRLTLIFIASATCLTALCAPQTESKTSSDAQSGKPLREIRTEDALKSHRIIMVDGDRPSEDSLRNMLETFYYDQFRHFKDPQAPFFLFMSRDAGLTMGIGGQLNIQGYYDWNQAMSGASFIPSSLPVPGLPTNRHILNGSVSQSKLFFRVLGFNKLMQHWQAYIEAKFSGAGGKDFHLSKAYLQFRDFTVGLAKSTYSDPAANPPTVDPQGPNCIVGQSNILARWLHPFSNGITVAASLELPNSQIATDGTITSDCTQSVPNGAAFIQYGWSKEQHIRLSGIVTSMRYRDIAGQTNRHATGYGLLLSTVFNPASPLTLYGYATYGKGTASLSNDLNDGNYDLIPDPERPGRMYTPVGAGWLVAAQYNFRPNIYSTVMFSEYRYLPSHAVASDTYKYGLYGAANIFYEFTPRIQFGLEYDYGRRQDMSRLHTTSHQVTAIATISF